MVDRDRVRFAGGFGLADRDRTRTATASTAHLWFSMTKIVTATTALTLVDNADAESFAARRFRRADLRRRRSLRRWRGFWNVMRLYPEQGVGIVVMTNSTHSYDFEPLFGLLSAQG